MSAVVYCGSMGDCRLLRMRKRMEGVDRLVKAGVSRHGWYWLRQHEIGCRSAAHAEKVGCRWPSWLFHVFCLVGSVISAQINHFKAILAAAPSIPAIILTTPCYTV